MNIQETGLLLDSLQAIYREIRTGEDSLEQWQRLLEHWNCLDIQKAAEEYSRNNVGTLTEQKTTEKNLDIESGIALWGNPGGDNRS